MACPKCAVMTCQWHGNVSWKHVVPASYGYTGDDNPFVPWDCSNAGVQFLNSTQQHYWVCVDDASDQDAVVASLILTAHLRKVTKKTLVLPYLATDEQRFPRDNAVADALRETRTRLDSVFLFRHTVDEMLPGALLMGRLKLCLVQVPSVAMFQHPEGVREPQVKLAVDILAPPFADKAGIRESFFHPGEPSLVAVVLAEMMTASAVSSLLGMNQSLARLTAVALDHAVDMEGPSELTQLAWRRVMNALPPVFVRREIAIMGRMVRATVDRSFSTRDPVEFVQLCATSRRRLACGRMLAIARVPVAFTNKWAEEELETAMLAHTGADVLVQMIVFRVSPVIGEHDAGMDEVKLEDDMTRGQTVIVSGGDGVSTLVAELQHLFSAIVVTNVASLRGRCVRLQLLQPPSSSELFALLLKTREQSSSIRAVQANVRLSHS